ncbi:bifunctional class I SAM-dependent methyltransferase/glycosyltransferase family 2 protein [Polynucleobacter sp. CS-Odin-A6]|uniref:bifunctional class I SAM-dependent methyltransferase/glycosyltransferase family 2 protein n=1 Tax=Polynucleobacter sp. CS-Odin-A6 TaxID=2689106 RepID=UPI001C0D8073|nr:bifunctional class I SAM-dependent methyltransferase/glycosyltransferase family 2 protein [Polynucleobacter sp. CS-Odin-A6]MBU3621104.1 glycosyltransferase [Polynucleobacter sp. CS-Odin-A6]
MPIESFYQKEARDYQSQRKLFYKHLQIKPLGSIFSSYYKNKIELIYSNIIPPYSSILEIGCSEGDLLSSLRPSRGVGIDFCPEILSKASNKYPDLNFITADANDIQKDLGFFEYIILSDLVNDLWDVQRSLEAIKSYCNSDTRLILNFHSHLWDLPLRLAQKLGLIQPSMLQNWLTIEDMENILEISNFQPLKQWSEILLPLYIPLFSNFLNQYIAKIFPFRLLNISNFMVARPLGEYIQKNPTVSVIIPARNEAGHIKEILERVPEMGGGTEIIFVEGNSSDDTYSAILEAISQSQSSNIKIFKQYGKGKGDAVRLGFEMASGDILMILDADITVPPEDLPRFFNLIANGTAEFVNGVRLIYPMEKEAMRFANLVGNKFFAYAFSWLLSQPIRDTLCGTKVLWKKNYVKIKKNRAYFGNFDPFGDFDLLFGAARLNLKISEIPVRYRARQYGETNISRWRHGWLLLRMVIFAARRIKFI